MHSPLFGRQVCIFAWSFLKVCTTCLRTAKALASAPMLVAQVTSREHAYIILTPLNPTFI